MSGRQGGVRLKKTGTEDFKRVDEGRDVFTMKEAQMSMKKKNMFNRSQLYCH